MATGKALDGTPYAGNSHVRLDAGESVSAKPRRGVLIHRNFGDACRMSAVIAAFLVFGNAAAVKADVWEDCAWRLGDVVDANANGRLDNGDLTEYFHAADADHTTGYHKITTSAVSTEAAFTNDLVIVETNVVRVTEGVTANQNVILFKRPVSGDNIYCGKVFTPCQLVGDRYTVICRFRMDDFNPNGGYNVSYVFSSGWCHSNWRHLDDPQGGNGLMFGLSAEGKIVIRNGQESTTIAKTTWGYMPESWYRPIQTNRWIDAAIIADGTTVRVYCSPENYPCRWWEYEPTIGEGASLAAGRGFCVDLGGWSSGKGSVSSGNPVKGFCGAVAELAAWNRALTKNEVVEAFGKCGPAVFRVGTRGRTKDFCGGAATSGTTSISIGTRNPAAVSRTLNANGRLEIPFSVFARNNGLPQLLRFRAAADSGAGRIRVAIDGNVISANESVSAGRLTQVYVKGQYLTDGDHTAVITCLSGPVTWDVVDLCGSFSYDIGIWGRYPAAYADGQGRTHTYFGDAAAEAIADAYAGDNARYDMTYLPCAAGIDVADKRLFRFHWDVGDLAGNVFDFNIAWGNQNSSPGEGENPPTWFLTWNGTMIDSAKERTNMSYSFVIDGTNIVSGDNVFCMDTDSAYQGNANVGTRVNSVTVTVHKPPKYGLSIFVR